MNERFFEEINTENAYIIGFILADGCVGINDSGTKILQIGISRIDRYLLEHIQEKMELHTKICDHTVTQKSGKISPMSRIKVTSNKICTDLEKFGIIPRKTGQQKIQNIPNQYMNLFMLGYFDGNGCLNKTKGRNGYKFSISSCLEFCNQVKDYFQVGNVYTGHGNCYSYEVCKLDDILKIKDMLYIDPPFYLTRKKELFDQIPNITRTLYTAFGESKTLVEWTKDDRCVVSPDGLRYRVNKTSMDFETCLTLPLKSKKEDMYKRDKKLIRKHDKYIERTCNV